MSSVVRLSDLWSKNRPNGIRFLFGGLIIIPARGSMIAAVAAVAATFISGLIILFVANASHGGAIFVGVPLFSLAITVISLFIVLFGDAGALPIHVSMLVGPDCGPREQARTEVAPIASLANSGGEVKFCLTCRIWRLPGSRHCSTCGHCVAGYDHHCAALGRCVGEGNLQVFTILVVASTLTAGAALLQCLIALYQGVPHCPTPSLAFLLERTPTVASIAATCLSIGGLIYVLTCLLCARSRLARTGTTCIILGLLPLTVSYFIYLPPCTALLPSLFASIISLFALVNFGAISVNHISGLVLRSKMLSNSNSNNMGDDEIAHAAVNTSSETDSIIINNNNNNNATIQPPRLTVREVLSHLTKVITTPGPPARVDFRADCTLLVRAIESANTDLFRAAAAGKPLESGSVIWRGGENVREALIASLQQSARLVDIETYATYAANVVPRGVLAGNDTFSLGLQPAAVKNETDFKI